MLGEPDQNIEIKKENVSSHEEEIKINENIQIQDNRIFVKEDTSEIHQQVYIKEEELSDNEDNNVNTLCDVDCGTESSNINGHPMDIDYKPVDINPSLPLAVFLKEEHDIDKDDQNADGVGGEEMFSNRANVEETFGNHFLSTFQDPLGVEGQSEKESTDLARDTGYMECQIQDKGALCNESHGKLFEKLGNGLIKCTRCKYRTSSLRKFNFHIKYTCGKPDIHHCTHCSYKCKIKSQLRTHVIKKHSLGSPVIDCPYCSFASLSFLEVQDHVRKKHIKSVKYYNCEQCDFKTLFKSSLSNHMKAKHTFRKHLTCDHCDYKCKTVSSWNNHMLLRHNSRITIKKRNKKSFYKKS